MQEYLLKVSKAVESDIKSWLAIENVPSHVRLATLAPLSNYGYPDNADAQVLKVTQYGVVTGQAGGDVAPHDFVPWQNVAYMSDGTGLAADMAKDKKK